VAAEILDAGSRFTKEQLAGMREFLRLGADLSYRRAEEIAAEVADEG
jgi:hypothetical protein